MACVSLPLYSKVCPQCLTLFVKGKGKVNCVPQESVPGAYLPLPSLEPVDGEH